jgi:hypothetical protein
MTHLLFHEKELAVDPKNSKVFAGVRLSIMVFHPKN